MNNSHFFNPENLSDETIHLIISERNRQMRNGKLMWIVLIIVGIIGSLNLSWLFFLFTLITAMVLGSIISYQTSKKIQRLTGLDINAQIATWKYIKQKEIGENRNSITSFAKFNILGKITSIEKKVKWSRAKMIQVYGPPIYGNHNIFVDYKFNVAVFLPKDDKTLHVFMGNIMKANRYFKFDANGNKLFVENFSERAFEWKINPKIILYRGSMLSPEQPVYKGKVVNFREFNEEITDEWLISMKNKFMEFMHNQ